MRSCAGSPWRIPATGMPGNGDSEPGFERSWQAVGTVVRSDCDARRERLQHRVSPLRIRLESLNFRQTARWTPRKTPDPPSRPMPVEGGNPDATDRGVESEGWSRQDDDGGEPGRRAGDRRTQDAGTGPR